MALTAIGEVPQWRWGSWLEQLPNRTEFIDIFFRSLSGDGGGEYKLYKGIIFINFLSRSKKLKQKCKSCVWSICTLYSSVHKLLRLWHFVRVLHSCLSPTYICIHTVYSYSYPCHSLFHAHHSSLTLPPPPSPVGLMSRPPAVTLGGGGCMQCHLQSSVISSIVATYSTMGT